MNPHPSYMDVWVDELLKLFPDAINFDLVMLADGSGTKAHTSCGWACVVFAPKARSWWVHRGGTTGGTNNYAELAPFVHALWQEDALKRTRPVKVLCVTDSELTVKCGTRKPDGTTVYSRNANCPLWASIDWFENNGFKLTWRHILRSTTPLNVFCDQESRAIRKLLEGYASDAPSAEVSE